MTVIGRPSLYNEEVLELSKLYIDNFKDEYEHAIPSVVGLAKILKCHRDTLYQWAKEEDKQEFSDILKRLSSNQEFELLNGGLKGELNTNITKLALGKHGYSDKQDTTVSNPDGTNLASSDVEIARKLAFVLNKALNDSE